MPVYSYKGLKADGKGASGIIDAESARVARQKLRKIGVYPTDVIEQQQPLARDGTVPSAASPGLGAAKLGMQELALMTRQLATLMTAGLPVVDALGVLIDQSEKKHVQTLFADIREQIRGGKPLSTALEAYPQAFTPIYVHMVRAGETSGTLDQILFRLAEFLEKQLHLKQRVSSAMTYPVIMSLVAVTVLFFLLTFVVPKITAVFADMKQTLPPPTRILMAVSHFLADAWLLLLCGIAAAAFAGRRFLATERGRWLQDRTVLNLPLLGDIARMVAISRFARTLSTMLSSGVSLLESLDVAKRVMNNRVLERVVDDSRRQIQEGEPFADPLKQSGEFPPLVTHMVAVGEKSGELEEMLRRVAQIYDGEVDRKVTRLTSLLEPIMILMMGLVVLFIVVAILLPIFEMGQMVR
jgi:general secretion pathway protein F